MYFCVCTNEGFSNHKYIFATKLMRCLFALVFLNVYLILIQRSCTHVNVNNKIPLKGMQDACFDVSLFTNIVFCWCLWKYISNIEMYPLKSFNNHIISGLRFMIKSSISIILYIMILLYWRNTWYVAMGIIIVSTSTMHGSQSFEYSRFSKMVGKWWYTLLDVAFLPRYAHKET